MKDIDKKVIKSGVWYTIANVVTKGITYLTTPIFARLMSAESLGEYTTLMTWQQLLVMILPMVLYASIGRAKFDMEDRLDKFISSLAVAGSINTAIVYLLVVLFPNFFMKLFDANMSSIHLMFIYVLVTPAMSLFQSKNHVQFKYKLSTIVSLVAAVGGTILGIVGILVFEDQMFGRMLGTNGFAILVSLLIYILIIYNGRCFCWSDVKYAMAISVPLLPHLVSMTLLSSSDKLVIKQFCGAEDVAAYGIAYTCAAVVSMLSNSVNEAMSPWLFQQLHDKAYEKIRFVNKYYVTAFTYVTIGVLLVAPEIMLIVGGKNFADAQGVLMPVMAGCCCNFLYTNYVNVENYLKKSGLISTGTVITAVTNIVLNYIFVPLYGYEAAAYTTMFCYFMLLTFHYLMVYKLNMSHVYNNKLVLGEAIAVCIFSILMRMTYTTILRPILIICYGLITILIVWKLRKTIFQMLKSFLKK